LSVAAAQAPYPTAFNNNGNAVVVADQVVNLQAQYGVDDGFTGGTTANDGTIDRWVDATAALGWDIASLTPTKIGQIRAVRIGIVVRSSQVERPTPGAATCPTTPTMPRALAQAATTPAKAQSPQMDTTNMPTPTCYRYKTYETVIPIRNPIWSDANLR
jgi:type IV pilus assembly protein PilW